MAAGWATALTACWAALLGLAVCWATRVGAGSLMDWSAALAIPCNKLEPHYRGHFIYIYIWGKNSYKNNQKNNKPLEII